MQKPDRWRQHRNPGCRTQHAGLFQKTGPSSLYRLLSIDCLFLLAQKSLELKAMSDTIGKRGGVVVVANEHQISLLRNFTCWPRKTTVLPEALVLPSRKWCMVSLNGHKVGHLSCTGGQSTQVRSASPLKNSMLNSLTPLSGDKWRKAMGICQEVVIVSFLCEVWGVKYGSYALPRGHCSWTTVTRQLWGYSTLFPDVLTVVIIATGLKAVVLKALLSIKMILFLKLQVFFSLW